MKIKNWQRLQHFKDRKPPWIKLYKDILEQRDINVISDCSFRVLIGLWILASEDEEMEGNLPSVDDISFRLRIDKRKINNALTELSSFLIQGDINPISEGYQLDTLETETEAYKEETETEAKAKAEAERKTGKKKPQKTTLPEGFGISDRVRDWASKKNHTNLEDHLENFISSAKAKSYTYASWDDAFMNAIRQNWAKIGERPHETNQQNSRPSGNFIDHSDTSW